MTGEIKGPQRAVTITLRIGGDTRKDVAHALWNLAREVETGEATTGSFGSPSHGGEYEVLEIDKPHEAYFVELHAYLAESRKQRESPAEGDTR